MPSSDLAFLSLDELAPLLARKKLSPVDLTKAILARIEQLNPRLNAYVTVCPELALRQAVVAEREMQRGKRRGPLHGIPVSLKDNIWTRGVRTTAGSKILLDFLPAEDAAVARRLARAGAILLGKTNLHEFAYGVTTVNPHTGATRNPWDTARIAGGSSGGSAAALAAGLCFASVGSDTGGSIRIPSALCGVVGIKPTFGHVSVRGIVPLAPSLDHAGPLARTVADAALVLRVIAGKDARDASTLRRPVPDFRSALRNSVRGPCLGRPREFFFDRLDEEVRRIVDSAIADLARRGARIEEISLPHVAESAEPSTTIALAEAAAYHTQAGWFPARAADYSEEVRKRLEMGAAISAADYLRACEYKKVLQADFDAAFARVDVILAPATPVAAPCIEQSRITIAGEEEHVRNALIRLNRPANLTGLPALSVPCGFTRAGLPVGLQMIGRSQEESLLLRLAYAYEQTHDWRERRPVGV